MQVRRAVLLVAVLVVPAAFAGCMENVTTARDWLGGNGDLVIAFGTLPSTAPGQRMSDMSTLKVAVTSVVATPVGEVRPHAGVLYQEPLGIDLRKRFDDGELKPVLKRTSLPTKPIAKVEIKIFLVEAKDNAQNAIPACPSDGTPAEKKPCIAMPKAGAFVLDKSADPPHMQRAKTMTMDFPLALIYNPDRDEYFLQSRSAAEEAPVSFS